MTLEECWVEVEDFPRYLVSSYGRIQNIETGRILKQNVRGNNGYLRVNLCTDSGCMTINVHTLVALAFVGELFRGVEVNHVDGNKLNNSVENLEIVTHSENMLHAFATGLKHPAGGKSKQVRDVETQEIFESISAAARSLNVTKQCVSMMLHGRMESAAGHVFEFVN